MEVNFIFAWYDLWIGAFWDSSKRRLYILPLPCIGICLQFYRPQCIGYYGGCDGDLCATPHEENCPMYAEDKKARPYLYETTHA